MDVLLRSPSSLQAAVRMTGEVLFNQRVEVAPYVEKRPNHAHKIRPSRLRKGEPDFSPDFRWGWYSNASSSVNDIKLRYPRLAPLRGIFESWPVPSVVVSVCRKWEKGVMETRSERRCLGSTREVRRPFLPPQILAAPHRTMILDDLGETLCNGAQKCYGSQAGKRKRKSVVCSLESK